MIYLKLVGICWIGGDCLIYLVLGIAAWWLRSSGRAGSRELHHRRAALTLIYSDGEPLGWHGREWGGVA